MPARASAPRRAAPRRCAGRWGARPRSRPAATAAQQQQQQQLPHSLDEGGLASFAAAVAGGANLVPLCARLFSDHLTPVSAYRCLVRPDDREAPSFLLESVVNGDQSGRYSYLGAQPSLEVLAKEGRVTVLDHARGTRTEVADPLQVCVDLSRGWRPHRSAALPAAFCGGFVGYVGYDTVRYGYAEKLPFGAAPTDDRGLLDLQLGLYTEVVVFDHATKLAHAVVWTDVGAHPGGAADAHAHGAARLRALVARLQPAGFGAGAGGGASSGRPQQQQQQQQQMHPPPPHPPLPPGRVTLSLGAPPPPAAASTMTKAEFCDAVRAAQRHIAAGDVFQVVLSQRFERRSFADPFEVYRSLRVVNPSPYMIYLQARGAVCVASSPEILCRVTAERGVVNRPLAGTRRRGGGPAEDAALAAELLADAKEVSEHTMLVDLGRNDVGRVAAPGSVRVERLMDVERYSHVMHLSSTVTGTLAPGLTCWDALRAALPAGTVSGAPKVRAMQLIDGLEPTRRGPYGGGIGIAAFTGEMDMALALRTMVVPTRAEDALYAPDAGGAAGGGPRREWAFHIQAGAGLVADSVPDDEYTETVNKAAGMARAIDLAEAAFVCCEL